MISEIIVKYIKIFIKFKLYNFTINNITRKLNMNVKYCDRTTNDSILFVANKIEITEIPIYIE